MLIDAHSSYDRDYYGVQYHSISLLAVEEA